ncbi:MAG TPA: glycoside hydrolase family 2 TIM barrel-domain containing protein [Rectinema sp.]|nr:glycoside hydrolase family 2 TIM barrel-domain containing protein [Rectinema sp.]
MRMKHPWNANWWFRQGQVEEEFLNEDWPGPRNANSAENRATTNTELSKTSDVQINVKGWKAIHLPHDMTEAPFNSFDERAFLRFGCYAKKLEKEDIEKIVQSLGEERIAANRKPMLFLRFEGVSVSCRVWVNGRLASSHKGPYTPFEVRIDSFIPRSWQEVCSKEAIEKEIDAKTARPIWILVEVDSSEDSAVPPFGGVVDYLAYGGIYRGVSLCASIGARLSELWTVPRPRGDALDGPWLIHIRAEIETLQSGSIDNCCLIARLYQAGELINEGNIFLLDSIINKGENRFSTDFSMSVDRPKLWDIDSPTLYDLELALHSEIGQELDYVHLRIGFRTAEFGPSGFYLNQRRIFLRGLDRHQEYPYIGYAMGPDGQKCDAKILKQELGCIIVRTSHYPQSPHFLDACDELGLLVFEELPGWQHIGDSEWQEQALRNLEDMILRDRNHPSIVLWGVRINESKDNHEFYAKTNELARRLDPYRQTGGVRCHIRSELLEDVYTFNDFTYDGKGTMYISEPSRVLPKYKKRAPYLITEHTGHMFPTKRFDQEERLVEHALRHAHVLDNAMGNSRVAGCIGWCAFDYHTHKDFGSGDRICYHGAADAFRIPKYAGFFYGSQVSPSERLVLEPASIFAKGERNASHLLPIYIFTNCDAVDVYRSESFIARFFPDKAHFANLPHPPIVIDDLIGSLIETEAWPQRDFRLFRKLAGKAMALGENSFDIWDKLRMALFMRRQKLGIQDIEELVLRYGMNWGASDEKIRLVGILDGKEVVERSFGADSAAKRLSIEPDALWLKSLDEEEWPSTRIVVKALDQYDNIAPFLFEPYSIDIKGPARLIGPARRSLISGVSAFWISGKAKKGKVSIAVACPRFEEQAVAELDIELE